MTTETLIQGHTKVYRLQRKRLLQKTETLQNQFRVKTTIKANLEVKEYQKSQMKFWKYFYNRAKHINSYIYMTLGFNLTT